MKRAFFIVLAIHYSVGCLQAQRCAVCDLRITTDFYEMKDMVTGLRMPVCPACAALDSRCFFCGLPVKNNPTRLEDGRVLCARDSKGVVISEDESKQVCDETRTLLASLFSRFLTFPDTNVTVTMADRVQMQQLFQTPGFDRECPSVYGYIRSRPGAQGESHHAITLLGGLPRTRLMATCAHEMTHAWLDEHLPDRRNVSREAVEGFCELVAFKLMNELGQEQEQKIIKANQYTRGQVDLFIRADEAYGFYTVLEWMTAGLDLKLSDADLDRVRQIELSRPHSISNEITPLPTPALSPVPETLTLLGILGAGARRTVLINDRALGVGESGKVRFGTTNALVRCVEIKSNSVLIEVAGSMERQELTIQSK